MEEASQTLVYWTIYLWGGLLESSRHDASQDNKLVDTVLQYRRDMDRIYVIELVHVLGYLNASLISLMPSLAHPVGRST